MKPSLIYYQVPRVLLGSNISARDLVVFSFLFTQRNRVTDSCWVTIQQICDATGYRRRAVEYAIETLQRRTSASGNPLVEVVDVNHPEDPDFADPEDFGASEFSKAKKFYKLLSMEGSELSKAPAWLIAMPDSAVCGRAKMLAFLLGGLEEYCKLKDLEWRGERATKSATVLGISKSQYCRAFLQLCKAGAFSLIQRRHRHATLVRLSYNGPSNVRYKRGGSGVLDKLVARMLKEMAKGRLTYSGDPGY